MRMGGEIGNGGTDTERVREFMGGWPAGLLAVGMINFDAYHSLSLYYILHIL